MSKPEDQYQNYTKQQKQELETLARPLIKWLNDNCHPHNEIRISHHSAELFEGQMAITTADYIKD